jgi:hypothetical protein
MVRRALPYRLVSRTFRDYVAALLPPPGATPSQRRAAPFPNQKALAAKLEMNPYTVSRAFTKGDHFDEIGCLKLAIVGNYSASDVLRSADKSDLADRIEFLYGAITLTPTHRQLLKVWDRSSDEARDIALRVLKLSQAPTSAVNEPTPRTRTRATRRSKKQR